MISAPPRSAAATASLLSALLSTLLSATASLLSAFLSTLLSATATLLSAFLSTLLAVVFFVSHCSSRFQIEMLVWDADAFTQDGYSSGSL
jgi:hypothetical protein